jgi:growth arrest-specific protein 8
MDQQEANNKVVEPLT